MSDSEKRWPSFSAKLKSCQMSLSRTQLSTVQINIGKLCNQACLHCHVDAGPNKLRENMAEATVDRLIGLLEKSPSVKTVDITGGAPELNPYFRKLVTACRQLGLRVIDRCNLTVLFEPGQEDTVAFLAANSVEVVASLPCYSSDNVEAQRGDGVFDKSIRGLQWLNEVGYGREGSGLILNLVYNPNGAFLPPAQETLREDYKVVLRRDFGIEFNDLYTITNMPIKRFLFDLKRSGKYEGYMSLLEGHFNPEAVAGLMCRSYVSISWDGKLYDCDFNQMLAMPIAKTEFPTLWDLSSFADLDAGPIAVGNHCYGCTAGAGSSCGGSLAK